MRRIIFFLVLVELTSGILQGYYTPILTDIARHLGIHDADVNWFEAGQLMLSALAVPLLAKLGDVWGHKRILLVSSVLTALASWGVVIAQDFTSFLIAWALQGFYVVWLPMEIALIHSRVRDAPDSAARTRKAAGILVGALEFGVIAGALASGSLSEVFAGSLWLTLTIPAIAATLVCAAIAFGVPSDASRAPAGRATEGSGKAQEPRRLDTVGFGLLAGALLVLTSGLTFVRLNGTAAWWPWVLIVSGVLLLVPFARHELRTEDPLVDIRMVAQKNMWPVFLTAGLFGVSVLGAQAPLSTFARTDPKIFGYGMGLAAGQVSIIIGVYVLSLLIGALLFPVVTKVVTPRWTLVCAAVLVGVGYLLFLPFHASLVQAMVNMAVAGLGSGALVAALPSAAAAAAPAHRTGMATGLTNTTKTIGGAVASAVFGIALFTAGSEAAAGAVQSATAAPLAGYLTVWAVCGVTALVAAVSLVLVPRNAFADPQEVPSAVVV
ncbi:MFS transporter [Pseudarthrobacter sp. J1763]|uniref:MFS transporter n=1 Tax=Pseudarthrobacter sp. J1763 TaxID=3420445 RepID=UPI003D2C38BD